MPIFTPPAIRDRFARVKVQREPGGANLLLGLPKRMPGELEAVSWALASRDCRECAKCCSGGFNFTKKDPNFEEIMGGINKNRKRFVIERDGTILFRELRFEVFVPMGKRACGFLDGQEQAYSQLQFAEGLADDEGAVFGCGLYANRPSVCKSYPFIWERFGREHYIKGADNAIVALDPVCPAMWELGARGIGHITGKEIEILEKEGESVPDSLLGSFSKSLVEIFRRLSEDGKWGRIFLNEDGEKVYPLDFPPVIGSLRDY